MGACGCPRVCSSVPATTARYSLALHDALPIFDNRPAFRLVVVALRDLVVGHDFAALLAAFVVADWAIVLADRKSTRLNSSHGYISYAVFCLKNKSHVQHATISQDPRTTERCSA